MQKRLLLLSIVILGLLLFTGCSKKVEIQPVIGGPQAECTRVGGEWKTFGDSCADRCEPQRNKDIGCLQALGESCDCGPDQCWNGKTCEPN